MHEVQVQEKGHEENSPKEQPESSAGPTIPIEPVEHPMDLIDLPKGHRRDPPREWHIHQGKLSWDELTLGLHTPRLHRYTKLDQEWAVSKGTYHLLITLEGRHNLEMGEETTKGDPHSALWITTNEETHVGSTPAISHGKIIIASCTENNEHLLALQDKWGHMWLDFSGSYVFFSNADYFFRGCILFR